MVQVRTFRPIGSQFSGPPLLLLETSNSSLHELLPSSTSKVVEILAKRASAKALFSSRNEKFSVTVALSFVCGKYYLIID